jgi:DNA-directed RNA polymerase I, II, and III subunit RPABC2
MLGDDYNPEAPEENIDIVDADGQQDGGAGLPRQRITTRYMTKYEKARVLGTRALQIR